MADFDLGALSAYLQPTDADKQQALTQGLLAAGFGIMANNTGNYGRLGPALGAGGLTGMNAYSSALQNAPKERQAAISGALNIRKLQDDLKWDQLSQNFFGGAPGGLPGAAPAQPGLPTAAPTAPSLNGVTGAAPALAASQSNTADPANNRMPQELNFISMAAAAGRPNAAALQKSFELRYPEIKWQNGVAMDPRTGQPVQGAPVVPQTNQQGFSNTLKWNAQTGQFEEGLTPGSTDVYGTQQDITNRSAARFGTPREVTLPDGRKQVMTPEQYSDYLNGTMKPGGAPVAAPSAAPVPGKSSAVPDLPLTNTITPDGVLRMTAKDDQHAQDLLRYYGASGKPVSVTVAAKSAPAAVPGGPLPTSSVTGMPGITTGLTNDEQQNVTARGKAKETAATEGAGAGVRLQDAIDTEASHALEQKRILMEMKQSFQDISPGAIAPAKKKLLELAQAFHYPLEQKQLDEVSSMQDIAKLNAQLATSAMKQFTNRGTQMEFGQFLKNNPGIEMTPQGAQKIIGFMIKGADTSLQKQQEFIDWKQTHPADNMQDFNAHWNKQLNANLSSTLSDRSQNVDQTIKNSGLKNVTDADIRNTAMIHHMTVDQVKQQLGIQ